MQTFDGQTRVTIGDVQMANTVNSENKPPKIVTQKTLR